MIYFLAILPAIILCRFIASRGRVVRGYILIVNLGLTQAVGFYLARRFTLRRAAYLKTRGSEF